ncbi:MRC [Mytilus coruscus]|uniref:MRC n=1 Tax=Mytilus coruscus TaxID=42192 RepID=A0A6J8E4X3_MYTCO|nr:MRC [Mytilus coruscus]
MMCAIRCFSEEKCCVASYFKSLSTCRLDTSENCCVDMEIVDGWETFKTDKYVNGYWLGGYNFDKDGNLEWISNPDQPMTYSDMNPGEPSSPTTERCLVYWRAFGYSWGDAYCSAKLPYVCEFFKTKISMNINLSYGVCLLYFYGVQGRAEKNFVIKVGYKPLP